MKFEMKKNEGATGGSKRYHFELSFGGLLGVGAVAVVGLVWVFVFGVLVGRGYQPEKQVPELATLMPASQSATAEMTETTKQDNNKVIPPEELDYYANLKEESRTKKATKTAAAGTPAAKKPKEPAKELSAPATVAAKPAAKPEEKELKTIVPASSKATAAMAAPKSKPKKQETPKQAAAPAKPAKIEKAETKTAQVRPGLDAPVKTSKERAEEQADTQVYDYVYQIASLQDPNAALRFRDKVKKLGLKAEVNVIKTDSKVWHRVVVHFRGMPEDTRGMKEKLERVGVDKPLMKSKKPI